MYKSRFFKKKNVIFPHFNNCDFVFLNQSLQAIVCATITSFDVDHVYISLFKNKIIFALSLELLNESFVYKVNKGLGDAISVSQLYFCLTKPFLPRPFESLNVLDD